MVIAIFNLFENLLFDISKLAFSSSAITDHK